MPNALPLDQTLPAGTLVSIPLSFYDLYLVTRPNEGDIVSACQIDIFTASSFKYNLGSSIGVSEAGVLYGTIEPDTNGIDPTGNDVLSALKLTLNNKFRNLVGINLSELDAATTTSAPTMTESITDMGTKIKNDVTDAIKGVTDSLAAAGKNVENTVIIILIISVIGLYILSKSKNIHVGI